MRVVLLTISLMMLIAPWAAQATVYKWKDENGRVYFGDRIPTKYRIKEHDELSHRGVVVKHREAAKTAEERAEEKRLAKERHKVELAAKRKRQRDRVLLDTYTTERDLVVARDARIEAVESQIQLAEAIIRDSSTSIASLVKKITAIKASSRDVPDAIYQRLAGEKQQVEVQSKVKTGHIKRLDRITTQFNGYIVRFNALKAEQKARRELLARERGEL